MPILNLNQDNWALLESTEQTDAHHYISDVVALADYISNTNTDDLCDINNYQYTH